MPSGNNRYYKGDPYRGELYTPPIQFIGQALESAQKKYDTNFIAAESLKNKYIQALPQDRARANQLQSQFESQIDGVVNKYGGDYSQASKDLYKLQSEMGRAYGPGGEVGAIQQNYALVQDSVKRERERLAKGEITQNQLSALNNAYSNFQGTKLDSNTGAYSQVPVQDLAQYVDDSKIFEETLKGIKPRTVERSYKTGRKVDGQWEYQTDKTQVIDPDEVASAFTQNLLGDGKLVNYISQMSALTGTNPATTLTDLVNHYRTDVIPVRTGILEDSKKREYKDDWRDKANFDFNKALTLELIRQKNRKELKDYGNTENNPQNPSFLTVAAAGNGQFKPLTLDGPRLNWINGKTIPGAIDVRSTLANGNNSEINMPMLQSIVDANPGMQNSDYLRLYNQHVTNDQVNSRISYDKYETTGSQKEDFTRLLPELLQGTREIQRINKKTGKIEEVSQAEAQALGEAWSKNRKNISAIGKSRSDSGHVSVGTILPDPTGEGDLYVIKENRNDMINLQNQVLDKAFKYKQQGLREGSVFDISTADGKGMSLIGRQEYENGVPRDVYYEVTKTGYNTHVVNYDKPLTKNGVPITASELEDALLPWTDRQTTRPHKSKPNIEAEYYFNEDN